MRSRFLVSTILIALSALVVLGVPLGIALSHLRRDEALRVLDQRGQQAAFNVEHTTEAGAPTDKRALTALAADGTIEIVFASGHRVVLGDTRRPITWGATADGIDGIVSRAGIRTSVLDDKRNSTWLFVAGLGLLGIAAAAALATWQARRLAKPLRRIAETSHRLGDGDFSARGEQTGITELDEIVTALNRSAERIGELVGNETRYAAATSHQLRTPLTSLCLRLEGLAERDLDPELGAEVAAALANAHRMVDTIDELVEMRTSGRAGPESTLDLQEIVTEHVRSAHPTARRNNRTITAHTSPATVRAARGAIGQALDVLIDNAVNHGTGTITVTLSANTGSIARITVADEGHTLARRPLDHLFDPPTPTARHGVGLPLARTLIESDGGRLQLISTEPTTFEILLPAQPANRPKHQN